jgi:hypothetical protein
VYCWGVRGSELRIENPCVGGSNPSSGTTFQTKSMGWGFSSNSRFLSLLGFKPNILTCFYGLLSDFSANTLKYIENAGFLKFSSAANRQAACAGVRFRVYYLGVELEGALAIPEAIEI